MKEFVSNRAVIVAYKRLRLVSKTNFALNLPCWITIGDWYTVFNIFSPY